MPLPSPVKWTIRWKANLAAALSFFILAATLLPLNVVQMLSVIILPFSTKAFRQFNEGVAELWWGLCVFAFEKIYRVSLIFSGDFLPLNENVIIMSNHQQMSDIVVLLVLAKRQKRLGKIKWFVKDVLKYVPGVGWGMLFLGCLFIKRNWAQDSSIIKRQFDKIIKNQLPFWTIIFVEGTRITAAKLQKSQEYALKSNITPTQNVLIPRTQGLVATTLGLRSHLQAIYDVTIIYPHGVPSLWQLMGGQCQEVHMDIRRFAMKEIPVSAENLAKWITQRFYVKDEKMTL